MNDQEVRRGIGRRLRECRVALRLSQLEVATKLKCTPQTISKWENGKSMPAAAEWYKLGILYGASLDYMVYGQRSKMETPSAILQRIFDRPGVEPSGAYAEAP